MLVYGKYSRGYRAGGVSAQAPTEFATYQPEKVDTYEVGFKTTFHAVVSGTFDIAAFYNNFRDQQLQLDFNPKPLIAVSPASGILNAGKSRISGVEVETSLNLFEGFIYRPTTPISTRGSGNRRDSDPRHQPLRGGVSGSRRGSACPFAQEQGKHHRHIRVAAQREHRQDRRECDVHAYRQQDRELRRWDQPTSGD